MRHVEYQCGVDARVEDASAITVRTDGRLDAASESWSGAPRFEPRYCLTALASTGVAAARALFWRLLEMLARQRSVDRYIQMKARLDEVFICS
jgi:hypothetical protein